MSRSFKKTPVFGNTTAASEKNDKKRWNHRFRRRSRQCIAKGQELPTKLRAISEAHSGRKDGKHYKLNCLSSNMRK